MEMNFPPEVVAVLEQNRPVYIEVNGRVYRIFPEPYISNHGIERLGRLEKRAD